MTIIDSSVWIAHFKDAPKSTSDHLMEIVIRGDEIAIVSVVLFEVLAGFHRDQDFKDALKMLTQVPLLPTSSEIHIEAAKMYRSLRKKGVTIRSPADCVIAQTCIDSGSDLFTLDKDFKRIAKHTNLKLVL